MRGLRLHFSTRRALRASSVVGWLGSLALALLAPSRAVGQSASTLTNLKLEWPRVEGCPDEGYVRATILRSLGSAHARAQEVRARVAITFDTTWQLRLVVEGPDGAGERILEGSSCIQAADAMAVILAMLIDPEAVRAAAHERTPIDEPPQSPTVSHVQGARVTSVQVVSGSVALHARDVGAKGAFGISVGVAASAGLENVPRAAIGLTLDRALGAWRGFADASYWPQHRDPLRSDPRRGANVSVGALGIAVGPRVKLPRFELVPRVRVAGHWARARGYGVDEPMTDSLLWWAVGVGQASMLELDKRIWLLATLDVTFPIVRPAARLEPGGDVLRPGVIGAQAYLGVLCRY